MTTRVLFLKPDSLRKANLRPTDKEVIDFLGANRHRNLNDGEIESTPFFTKYPHLSSFMREGGTRYSILYSTEWSATSGKKSNSVASSVYHKDRPNFMCGNVILIAEK